jgi:exonuclease V gamma subunit
VWTLGPIARAEARAQLRMLVGHYWQGLQAPLLFFPETARAYYAAQAERPEGPPSLWEDRARSVWRPERPVALRAPAEGEDLHARRLLGDAEPFDPNFHLPGLAHAESPRFAELATAIWQPLIAVLRDEAER